MNSSEAGHDRRSLHVGGPDYGRRFDVLVADRDAREADMGDATVGPDLDPSPCKARCARAANVSGRRAAREDRPDV
jgi:hypothetical protein